MQIANHYIAISTIIAGLAALGFFLWLVQAGFFRYWGKVFDDCLFNHLTGRYEINNLSRFSALWTLLLVFIAVHFTITFKPFHIEPHPLSEFEIGLFLAFIAGAELVKWYKNKAVVPDPPKVEITSENTTVNQPLTTTTPEPAAECPAAKKAREEAETAAEVPFKLD